MSASSNPSANDLFDRRVAAQGKRAIRFWSNAKDPETQFLSNFAPSPFMVSGKRYETVEHYYQSRKLALLGLAELAEQARQAATPQKAKSAGGKGATRTALAQHHPLKSKKAVAELGKQLYADRIKPETELEIMETALFFKFQQNPKLASRLVATGDAALGETRRRAGGPWEITKDGQAGKLGELLMRMRAIFGQKGGLVKGKRFQANPKQAPREVVDLTATSSDDD